MTNKKVGEDERELEDRKLVIVAKEKELEEDLLRARENMNIAEINSNESVKIKKELNELKEEYENKLKKFSELAKELGFKK